MHFPASAIITFISGDHETHMKSATQPTKPSRSRMEKADRYAVLLKFAVEACGEKGIAGVTHGDIAKLAHVSIPTVFFYFKTREALIEHILSEVERFHMGLTRRPSAETLLAEQELVEMVLACADGVHSHPAYMRVWLDWSTAIGSPYWPRYRQFVNRAIRIFRRVLIRGQKTGSISKRLAIDDAARIIVGEAHMVAMMMFSGFSKDRIRAFVVHLIKGALHFSGD